MNMKKCFNWNSLLFPLLFIVMVVTATVTARLPIYQGFIFIISQITAILIPGIFLLKEIDIKFKNRYVFFFVAYAVGYSISILLYIVLMVLNLQKYSVYFAILICVFSCVILFVQRKEIVFSVYEENKDGIFLFSISTVLFVICYFAYQCNSLVKSNGFTNINQDLMFWMKNTVAATRGFPLEELAIAGVNFNYHYFSSLQLAYLHYVTGIEVFDLCFSYSYVINIVLLVGSTYVLCDELLKNPKYKFLAIVSILLTEGFQKVVVIYYLSHFYVGSFGCAEGFSISIFALYFFIRLFNAKEKEIQLYFLSMITIFVAIGLKAPIACIIIAMVGVGCLILLFNKKSWKKGLFTGISYLAIFGVVYFVFVTGIRKEPVVADQTLGFSLTDTILSGYSGSFYRHFIKLVPLKWLGYLICFIAYPLFAHPFAMVLLLSSLYITRRIKFEYLDWNFLSGLFFSYFLSIFVSQSGHSQMYFYFVFPVFSIIYGLLRLEKIGDVFLTTYKIVKVLLIVSFTFSMLCSICFLGKASVSGMRHLILQNYNNNETGLNMSKNEIIALRWIRENSDSDDIVVSNKIFGEVGGRSFIVSSFTERNVYLDGYEYSSIPISIWKEDRQKVAENIFLNGNIDRNEIRKLNIKYLIVFTNLPYSERVFNLGELVYSNDDVIVIKI